MAWNAAEAATRGAELLDQRQPNWAKPGLINLRLLDLNDSLTCVLGQLYGLYDDGLDALHVWGRACELGFCASPGNRHRWGELTEAWRAEIRKRRHPKSAEVA